MRRDRPAARSVRRIVASCTIHTTCIKHETLHIHIIYEEDVAFGNTGPHKEIVDPDSLKVFTMPLYLKAN